MVAYLVLFFAALSRVLPHAMHSPGLNFTAVGGGLLFFGARRSRWQTIIAVLALMETDYYLTVFVYNYPFHITQLSGDVGVVCGGLPARTPDTEPEGDRTPRRRSCAGVRHFVLCIEQLRRLVRQRDVSRTPLRDWQPATWRRSRSTLTT